MAGRVLNLTHISIVNSPVPKAKSLDGGVSTGPYAAFVTLSEAVPNLNCEVSILDEPMKIIGLAVGKEFPASTFSERTDVRYRTITCSNTPDWRYSCTS